MKEITIRYWSPHGRQEETKYRCDDKKIDLKMRAAIKVDLADLRRCTQLIELSLSNNMLEEIDLSPLSANDRLTELRLESNHLTSLDLWPLSKCTSLKRVNLIQNRLPDLDLTPVLARSHVLLDSSVVISADNILQYLFTSDELAERFLLVRPDRAPWTAPPVLMWVTYETLAKKFEWSLIHERILDVLHQVPKTSWYAIQRGLLIGFGIEELAGFDGDPSEILVNTDESMDYQEARRAVFDQTVELLDQQIANGGPTLFLDTEAMKETRASKLIAKIVEARKKEIENTVVLTKGSTSLLNSLWLTHYGYKILEAMNVGMRHFGVALEDVKRSLDDLGFTLQTREVKSLENEVFEQSIKASQSMKNFVYNQIEKAYQ